MELRHLRYFRAIGREQHFGRAAVTLRVAQPALTRQIRDLEAELGVELFERLPRGVRLSSAGRVFLEEVEEILSHVDRAAERARRLGSGHLGTIRVGLSEIITAHGFISHGLLHFREREPTVALDLRSMGSLNQINALKEGTLDAGIVYDAHIAARDDDMLDRTCLGIGETMLAVHEHHRLAGRQSVSMAELADEPVLAPTRQTAPEYYNRLMAACIASGSAPRIVQECTTNSILLSLVAVGMGVGFVTASHPLSPANNIRLVPITDLGLRFEVLLVWRNRDRSAALRRFIDMMVALARTPGTAPSVPPQG
ncbi:LysR family transcriptional regulator [Hephaestia sp. GCM10023244]|uniref:LysR family transcriptional regulator n=1 Tax=unclassified Hephaestia TaxID=2631281 RepID=UPI00207786B4|nr:LysR family transcriptional regulator [Hephaestia sp. MAHUQ-44]MCM8732265.1 LysR family transcriptional regulator [Hephaestia sp. MAHUQ-44]